MQTSKAGIQKHGGNAEIRAKVRESLHPAWGIGARHRLTMVIASSARRKSAAKTVAVPG